MLTTLKWKQMKENNEKITMLTAYDYPSAKQAEQAGVDTILVGDSLGMVVLGYQSTTEVTIDDMVHHAKAVRRGAPNTFVVVDMPFMSYHESLEKAVENATRLFQSSNAQALKIEGASDLTLQVIKRLTEGGIPVVGHLGLTPQMVNVLGGYRVQAKNNEAIDQLIHDAKQLEAHGAFAIVFECIPKEIGALVTESLTIPTIGIGAGAACDGQVLVYHDILQYGGDGYPKFVKHFGDFNHIGVQAIQQYVQEVKSGAFPEEAHTYTVGKDLVKEG
ncbi:MAG TPA: 3-methyl-2-oxobutanoate hydroxymethyltransferase [Candidatus Pseudogracilibacillus intestinigallinarum]|uniref:3-methyl-2-oxobutanoate hydroxymethyltransferase n=1 Tax=Candidatus Pseudogracilibacillus intestinigallinarum TaxID=2838742 RepID=A0A9D1PMI4_9BACI|nr:3-methyl-2-oxobutanoate hydroxymethyltransferase [Candidatus Pseudogracilibacillus intestinigallinarum]